MIGFARSENGILYVRLVDESGQIIAERVTTGGVDEHQFFHTYLRFNTDVQQQATLEVFEIDAPYIVNIPPMVPHSFKNLGDDVAELVVIFPTNVWEYDVLDYFPFPEK